MHATSPEDRADRLERQIMLAEIGLAGQARIAAHTARIPNASLDLRGFVASRYAERAGFAAVAVGAAEEAPAFIEDASARAVVEGSLAVLREIRAALSGGGV